MTILKPVTTEGHYFFNLPLTLKTFIWLDHLVVVDVVVVVVVVVVVADAAAAARCCQLS